MSRMTWHRMTEEELEEVLDGAAVNSAAHHGILSEFQRRAAKDAIETSQAIRKTAFYTGLIAFFTFLTVIASVVF